MTPSEEALAKDWQLYDSELIRIQRNVTLNTRLVQIWKLYFRELEACYEENEPADEKLNSRLKRLCGEMLSVEDLCESAEKFLATSMLMAQHLKHVVKSPKDHLGAMKQVGSPFDHLKSAEWFVKCTDTWQNRARAF
jgi:hypothetical protein